MKTSVRSTNDADRAPIADAGRHLHRESRLAAPSAVRPADWLGAPTYFSGHAPGDTAASSEMPNESRVRQPVTFQKLYRWAKRRHPNKAHRWVVRKDWRLETGKWDFAVKDGPRLPRHSQTLIQRHTKVEGRCSPFDGDCIYWATRMGHHPELARRVARLLEWQKGRCPDCGLFFSVDDPPEADHIVPLRLGGKEGYINWQLLQQHCHDAKTASDQSGAA